jgi:hypothetical protein
MGLLNMNSRTEWNSHHVHMISSRQLPNMVKHHVFNESAIATCEKDFSPNALERFV